VILLFFYKHLENRTILTAQLAIVDGCRWVAGIRKMEKETAEMLGISNPNDHIEFDVTKSNYSPPLKKSMFFRHGEGGCLEPVNLEFNSVKSIALLLRGLLKKCNEHFSRRELYGKGKDEQEVKEIIKTIRKEFPKFARQKEMEEIINYGLDNGFWAING